MPAALRQSPIRLTFTIVTAFALLASLLFTCCYVWEGRARIVLSGGCLTGQWITESGTGTFGPTWDEIDDDDSPDWRRSRVFWNPGAERWLPQLHREHVSPLGTWWTAAIPLWIPVLFFVAWKTLIERISAVRDKVLCRESLRRAILGGSWATALFAMAIVLLAFSASAEYDNGAGTRYTASEGALWTLTAETEDFPFLETSPSLYMSWNSWGEQCYFSEQLCPHTEFNAVSTIGRWSGWVIPLWITLVPPVILILALRRRFPPDACPRCGYDLTGNISGRCPECGAAVTKPVRSPNRETT